MHDAGLPARPPAREVRPRHRRRDGQVPPARRRRDLRRARAHGPGLLAAPPADRRPRQLRLARLRPGRRALHRVPAGAARDAAARRHRRGHRRLRSTTTTGEHRGAGGAAGPLPEPARQRQPGHRGRHGHQHPAAQPRRGHRRHRPPDRQPRGHARRPDAVRQGPRLPDRRADPRPGRASSTPTAPAAARSGCGPSAEIEEDQAAATEIVVTELPYQTTSARSPAQIAELVDDRRARRHRRRQRRVGRAARPASSSSSSATPTPTSCSTTSTSTRRCRRTSRSTWSRSSTACPARSTSRRRCRPTSTTRSRSSPGASEFRLDKAAGPRAHRRGPAQGARHDRRRSSP